MKVLLDTNVIFDVLGKRQPHYAASNQILVAARHNVVSAAVASHTVANLFYQYGKASVPFLRERLLLDVEVTAGNAFHVQNCLNCGISDLEDALQAAAAMSWQASFIVTRNVKDFKHSPVQAFTPADFIKRFLR